MLAHILSWLTTTSLFVFVNLTIGAIFLSHCFHRPSTSPHHQHGDLDSHRLLVRRPSNSLLERVRSFDFSRYNNFQFDPHHQVQEIQTGLVRTPSLIERLKSINFSHFQQYHPEHEHVAQYPIPPENLTYRAGIVGTPSLLDRVRSFNSSQHNSQQPENVTEHPTPDNSTNPAGIVRTPSLLAHLKSIDLSSLYRSDPEVTTDRHPAEGDDDLNATYDRVVHRSKSENGHEGSESRAENNKVIKKSASERGFEENERGGRQRKGVEKTTSFGDDEEVDAKADYFINRFKQQLKLQRLESLLRYRENAQQKPS